ncbi:MAG: MOSC domain-containing protein [Spongiibacteraceae bacterium]
MKQHVGTVKELWRYPVKSMAGEVVAAADIEKLGMVGDRCWAIRDEDAGELSSVRKLPKLLMCTPQYHAEPTAGQTGQQLPDVSVTLPDGTLFSSGDTDKDQHLSKYLGKNVSLQAMQPRSDWRFYKLATPNGEAAMKKQFATKTLPSMASISWLKMLELAIFATPLGRFHDVYPLHILSSNTLQNLSSLSPEADFNVQRFRPNLYIESAESRDNFDEFDWVGGRLYIGDTIIKCESRTVRCLMPAQPQPGFGKDAAVLRTIEKHTARHTGINATVIKAGRIKAGDKVEWQPESRYAISKLFRPGSAALRNYCIQLSFKLIDRLAK